MQIINRANARMFSEVRLIANGTNEVVSIQEALRLAEDEGLDLCIVSDKSNPPVVKVQDFKKILYEEKKAKSKQQKSSDLKEIQLKVNISDHDLATKMNAINRFLERGDKVKLMVRLKGRERESPERARALVTRVIQSVPCKATQVPGPITICILEPVK